MEVPKIVTKSANRLIKEKSPYLLQHAHNPVDWYPWGEEAFAKARREDKPVFVSIGYSTCHWCHVMEKESFENEEVARLLNQNFVPIKVDREERPDIDQIYMTACQAMTGRGGWPLTVFLTPDKKPFLAGTYFPKETQGGQTGLLELLDMVHQAWSKERRDLLQTSEELTKALRQHARSVPGQEIGQRDLERTVQSLSESFDHSHGGFGQAPKFPAPHNLIFLLRYAQLTNQKSALKMAEDTLSAMARGGIYDQVGFGFSRYSTDRQWLVPHFEKMLYDNALLTLAYLEGYQATKNELYAKIAVETLSYVEREMTSPEGAFYSAEDADSEGQEGKFYLWTPAEIKSVLGEEQGKEFCFAYNITAEGNFEGRSIPNLIGHNDQEIMRIKNQFNDSRHKLLAAREKREHPYKDDKVLTSWNSLMIAALARAAWVLEEPDYLHRAEKALDFITANLFTREGRLLARYRDGEAAILAFADDYAFLTWGLLELYRSSFRAEYLSRALDLTQQLIHYFWDSEAGGLFLNARDSEELIAQPKEAYDGALPSSNSVALLNFWRLARLTGDNSLEELALKQVKAFSGEIARAPQAFTFFLTAAMYRNASQQVVIVGEPGQKDTQSLIAQLNQDYLPQADILQVDPGEERYNRISPERAAYPMVDGKATAYLCQEFTCREPTTDPQNLRNMLNGQ